MHLLVSELYIFLRLSRYFPIPYHPLYHNIKITVAYETFKVFVVFEHFTFIVTASFYDASSCNTIAEDTWSSQPVLYCSMANTVSWVGGSSLRQDTCWEFTQTLRCFLNDGLLVFTPSI